MAQTRASEGIMNEMDEKISFHLNEAIRLKRCRNSLTDIARLPAEILIAIFQEFIVAHFAECDDVIKEIDDRGRFDGRCSIEEEDSEEEDDEEEGEGEGEDEVENEVEDGEDANGEDEDEDEDMDEDDADEHGEDSEGVLAGKAKAEKLKAGASAGPYAWLRVTHVCHRWREIALSTSCLWSFIYMTRPSHTGALLTLFLERSQPAPLVVSARVTAPDIVASALGRVLKHTRRIFVLRISSPRALKFSWPSQPSILRTLVLDGATPSASFLDALSAGVFPQMRKLTCSADSPVKARNLLSALGGVPLLQELAIHGFAEWPSSRNPDSPAPDVHLPHLQSIQIGCPPAAAYVLIRHLFFPLTTAIHYFIGRRPNHPIALKLGEALAEKLPGSVPMEHISFVTGEPSILSKGDMTACCIFFTRRGGALMQDGPIHAKLTISWPLVSEFDTKTYEYVPSLIRKLPLRMVQKACIDDEVISQLRSNKWHAVFRDLHGITTLRLLIPCNTAFREYQRASELFPAITTLVLEGSLPSGSDHFLLRWLTIRRLSPYGPIQELVLKTCREVKAEDMQAYEVLVGNVEQERLHLSRRS